MMAKNYARARKMVEVFFHLLSIFPFFPN